jgi:pimeloyl-ACP methyl ester carboxylesterase
MPYVDLDGIKSYYEIHGAGEPLLLLHGGFCTIDLMTPQIDVLSASYEVHAPERPAHGRTPDRDGPISFDGMVTDTLAYLDALGLESAHVVGFSDGAIIGLLLARDHPDRVRSLVAISGNLDPGGFVADTESSSEGESPDEDSWGIRRAYNRLSPDGAAHGDVVMEKLMAMWLSQPQIAPESLGTVRTPTMVMAGQHDAIRSEHTLLIASSIPGAQVAIVPGASHMLMNERPEVVNLMIGDFLRTATPPG